MGDILNEAYGIVQCKECPWYKVCVTPMRFTAEDVRRQLESAPGMNFSATDLGFQNLLSSMATAAQNSLLEGCPIFIERLRHSPKLAFFDCYLLAATPALDPHALVRPLFATFFLLLVFGFHRDFFQSGIFRKPELGFLRRYFGLKEDRHRLPGRGGD